MCVPMEQRSRRGAAAYVKAFGCYCDTDSLKAKQNKSGLHSPCLSSVMAEEHIHQNEKATTHKTVNTQSFPA